jgi:hypothetical protein
MYYFLSFFIFSIILFLYIHVYHHLKTSNDLEVYTIEGSSKDTLEEVCDLRQPVIFDFSNESILNNCNLNTLNDKYGPFDIKIRNTKSTNNDDELYLPILLKEGVHLFESDINSKFITENNEEFIEETTIKKEFMYNDSFLRPPLVSKCMYDFQCGSKGAKTPLRYSLNYRNYLYVTDGHVKLKLICPHYSKYLYKKKDYDNFEFISPVSPWEVQEEYRADFDKLKVLDIELNKDSIIYIPAYWWYSISYEEVSSVCSFQYRTFMNTVAILPELVMSFLQRQNIKRNLLNTVNVEKIIEEKQDEQEEENKIEEIEEIEENKIE